MINIPSLKDLNKAIVSKIKTEFGNIAFNTDVTENIVRPSFYLELDGMRVQDFMGSAMDKNINANIQYFSTDRNKNKIELLETIDKLNNLFVDDGIIVVNDKFGVQVWDEVEIEIVDKVLHYNVPLFLSEDYNRVDNTPLMEEFNVNLKKEE